MTRPKIVCLCGSTLFWAQLEQATVQETFAGHIVLASGVNFRDPTHVELCGGVTEQDKERLDALHLWKIDLADEVLFLNVGGYMGESTLREYAYAKAQGKAIRWWERHSCLREEWDNE